MATSKQIIRTAFLNKGHYTAMQLNEIAHTGDARKYISDLRDEGMPIRDYPYNGSPRKKVYYCAGQGLPESKTPNRSQGLTHNKN